MKKRLTYIWLALALCAALAVFACFAGGCGGRFSAGSDSLEALAADSFGTSADEYLTVTFIDVGQGDSALVKTPGGTTLMIDGGGADAYKKQLDPFLKKAGISKIDYAVASHYHSDHTGGISQLLQSGAVETLVIPRYDDKNQTRERLVKKAQQAGVKITEISAGDTLDLGEPCLKISVLHPDEGGFDKNNENSNSLLLMLDCFGERFLFTGDLEEDAEATLIGRYDLEADVLKVGHHGSSTSTSPKFLAEVDPTYAVIDVGKGNRYGHPHFEVTARLENDDVKIYRTDEDGDITFKVSKNGIEAIETERGALTNGD